MPLKYRDYKPPIQEEVEFDPEAGKASLDPFHNEISYDTEETVEVKGDYESMTIKELKVILSTRNMTTSGKKADLIERLTMANSEPAIVLSDEAEEVPVEAATSDEIVGELDDQRIEADSLTESDGDKDTSEE
tara:strand:- start:796 stop:1194 length:399 start_codon:yes stop_codon:yes gene_type:complete